MPTTGTPASPPPRPRLSAAPWTTTAATSAVPPRRCSARSCRARTSSPHSTRYDDWSTPPAARDRGGLCREPGNLQDSPPRATPRRRASGSGLAADAVVVAVQVVDVGADDLHRAFDVRRTVPAAARAVDVAGDGYAAAVVRVAVAGGFGGLRADRRDLVHRAPDDDRAHQAFADLPAVRGFGTQVSRTPSAVRRWDGSRPVMRAAAAAAAAA